MNPTAFGDLGKGSSENTGSSLRSAIFLPRHTLTDFRDLRVTQCGREHKVSRGASHQPSAALGPACGISSTRGAANTMLLAVVAVQNFATHQSCGCGGCCALRTP